jgi:hypothetical protein
VADTFNHRIQKFNLDGTWLQSWGTNGSANGQFNYPYGIAVDTSGNVYVADSYNYRIQKFDENGEWLATWGTKGNGDGQIDVVHGLAVDNFGNVFVADSYNHRIEKFDSNGKWLITYGGVQGSNLGEFSYPFDVAVDSLGKIYVADTNNYRVQVFTPSNKDNSGSEHGVLEFQDNSLKVNEGKGSIKVKVVRTGGTDGKVSATYCFCNANAQKNIDYVAQGGTVTFDDGEKSKEIEIEIIDDNIKEKDEMFKMYLKYPQGGATLGKKTIAWVTIKDND